MSSSIVKKQRTKLAEKLSCQCHWKKHEVEHLLSEFQGKMDRTKFRDILHNTFNMTDDVLMDRVFRAFDRDNDSFISQEEMVLGLSIFIKGNLDDKIKHAFEVYDLNGDGYISREEMFHMLKNSLVKAPAEEDPDEGVKDLVELMLKKMDIDHDSRLSYADWSTAVHEEPLLIEAFGPCLPNEPSKRTFLAMVENSGKD